MTYEASSPADGTTEDRELGPFLAELRELRERAGQPSLRAMSRTAHYSHTALSSVLAGGRMPSLDLTLAFVRACGGNEEEWRARWRETSVRIAAGNDDEPISPAAPAQRRRRRRGPVMYGVAAALMLGAVAGGLTLAATSDGTTVRPSPARPPAHSAITCRSRPDPGDHPMIRCDDSRFIADVTIPDGTTVRANQAFVKTWEIQNSGLVPWRGRFLQRVGLVQGPGLCSSVSRVPIPLTMPGQDVQISVKFTAPSLPGSCRVDWKMTDQEGRLYFPGLGGLYMVVNVTG